MLEINLTPEQFAALGLPADGVTAESFTAALNALIAKAGGVEELTTKLSTSGATIADLEAKIAALTDAEKQRLVAALNAELEEYDLDEETAGVLGALTPEQRKPLLGKLPKKTAAPVVPPVVKKDPPQPVHNPDAPQVATPEAKAAEAEKLIATIRKTEGERFKTYEAARAEAKRRKSELFS